MDKEWTKLPRHWKRYRKGVKSFLDFAYTKGSPQGREISCPCAHCANGKWARRHVVRNHLIAAGFVEGYDVWVNHGEDMPLPMDVDKDTKDQQDSHDDIGGLLYDIFRDVVEDESKNASFHSYHTKSRNSLREKKGGEVSQAEVFVETRKKSRKGKEVDGETQVAIDKLQESIEKSAEAAKETFHSLFGKERSGRVRCHGRTATPSSLRKKEEIALVKKQYDVQHLVETRKKSRKGKEVDGETQVAIDKLQESIEKSAEAAKETFHSLFGKERSGRVRCHGRTATPSSLRKKEEIALVKKQYDGKIADMSQKMGAMEVLLKNMYMQTNPHLSEEDVDNMISNALLGDDNSPTPRSSTSTYAPAHLKVRNENDHNQDDDIFTVIKMMMMIFKMIKMMMTKKMFKMMMIFKKMIFMIMILNMMNIMMTNIDSRLESCFAFCNGYVPVATPKPSPLLVLATAIIRCSCKTVA
ncbi:hypothetical protein QL285_038762 [Trifolium repens]|nr:hypothetical protein QL285_038762 [Trifolium repens]